MSKSKKFRITLKTRRPLLQPQEALPYVTPVFFPGRSIYALEAPYPPITAEPAVICRPGPVSESGEGVVQPDTILTAIFRHLIKLFASDNQHRIKISCEPPGCKPAAWKPEVPSPQSNTSCQRSTIIPARTEEGSSKPLMQAIIHSF